MPANTAASAFQPSRHAVGWWLIAVAALIAILLVVGGLTRLTGSGLSITEWRPVTGVVPPLSETSWQQEFQKYQGIPQYRLENRGMSLSAFERIYWWEWTHRFLGRVVALAFLLPFLFFAGTGAIGREAIPRMLLLFALGGLQGLVGWWMVQSGLETRVSVSQYRLAIHLGVALILFAAVLWTALEYLSAIQTTTRRLRGVAFVLLVYVQMLLGALVAGLHAGLIYNTWPSMDGRLLPEHPFFNTPWWTNFFDHAGLAQFDHRIGAYIVTLSAMALWYAMRREWSGGAIRNSANALLGVTAAQVALGIATLVNQAPIVLSAFHQTTALALFTVALWHAFALEHEGAPPLARHTTG